MTYQYRRLKEIEEDIVYRFSAAGVRNRHPSNILRRLWNTSWQQLRTIVSLEQDGSFLEATAILSLPTTPAIAGEVYSEVPWPVNAVSIFGVRARASSSTNDRWYPLKRVPWAAHHDYQYSNLIDSWRQQPGPVAFCSRTLPSSTSAGGGAPSSIETAGQIMIFPVPRGGQYRLWYELAWQPLLQDDDLFPGHEEWHEWALYSTLIKMLGPDADSKKQHPIWSLERTLAREMIERRAKALLAGVGIEPRDGRGDGYDDRGWGGPL